MITSLILKVSVTENENDMPTCTVRATLGALVFVNLKKNADRIRHVESHSFGGGGKGIYFLGRGKTFWGQLQLLRIGLSLNDRC